MEGNRNGSAVLGMLLVLLGFPWAVHALTVLSSAVGLYPLGSAWAAWAVLVLAAGFAWFLWSRSDKSDRSDRSDLSDLSDPFSRLSRRLALAVLVAALVALFVMILVAVLMPVLAYDVLTYRLPTMTSWIEAGRVAWVPTDDPVRNGYPLGQEAIAAILTRASGSTALVDAVSPWFVAVGAVAVWFFAEASGVRRRLALAAAGLYVLVPMNILNAPTGYVDAAFGGAVVAMCVLAALASETEGLSFLASAGLGMAAALAIAIKGTGLPFAVAVIGLHAIRAHRRRVLSLKGILILSLFIIPGLFWPVRNLVHTGNPLWPIEVSVAGRTILDGVGSTPIILDEVHNAPALFQALPDPLRVAIAWLQLSGPATTFDDRLAGLGWSWPFLAVPAVILFLVSALRRRDWGNRILFLLLLVGACFLIQPLHWWSRYTVWLWGGGAVVLAFRAEDWARQGRFGNLAAGLLVIIVLAFGEGAWALVHAKGAGVTAYEEMKTDVFRLGDLLDLKRSASRLSWMDERFWRIGLDRDREICRGFWKPESDDTMLDGLFAQMSPRPALRVLDDEGDWAKTKRAWLATKCRRLILFSQSPVVTAAMKDPDVSVEAEVAFDPFFLVSRSPDGPEHEVKP